MILDFTITTVSDWTDFVYLYRLEQNQNFEMRPGVIKGGWS